MKVQAHSSLEPPLELQLEPDAVELFNHLESYRNIMQFQISSRMKNR